MINDNNRPRSWSVQCILEWLRIREQEGLPFPSSVAEFTADIDHSLLLKRLTEGREALKTAPPLSFGHPWYELVENGKSFPFEVWVADDKTNASHGYECVLVNHQLWRIVNTLKNEDYVVTYTDGGEPYRLWVQGIGTDPGGQSRKQWCIAKYAP